MILRYYVIKGAAGWTISDLHRIMPLPFNYLSRSYADMIAARFNQGGPESVRDYYYCQCVAGNRPYRPPKPQYESPYQEWMAEHADMFE